MSKRISNAHQWHFDDGTEVLHQTAPVILPATKERPEKVVTPGRALIQLPNLEHRGMDEGDYIIEWSDGSVDICTADVYEKIKDMPPIPTPTVLVIAFTLKDQSFDDILVQLKNIQAKHSDNLLLHGFMPREILHEKNTPTDVVDRIDELFPNQLNFYSVTDRQPLRPQMADCAAALHAIICVVGAVEYGVKDEVELYKQRGCFIEYYPLVEGSGK